MTGFTSLILLRHGHTAANGQGDHVPMSGGRTDTALSPLGAEQAAALAERLGPDLFGVPIYSSPLSRALRTVEALAALTGTPVRLHEGLREIDCGELEGMAVSEVKWRYPREWEENLRHEDPDFRWPGGESYAEFRERCLRAAAEVAAAHRGGRALVVTHAGVISQALGSTAGVSAARWDLNRPGNASVTELLWGPGGVTLVRFNDQTHLAPPVLPVETLTAPATTRRHAG
jgi:alpha-ribazole phosphatase/probable phosphoglycerate mutase